MNIRFFSLFHIQEGESRAQNVTTRSFTEQVDVYLGNAVTLSNSMRSQGLTYTLLTNRKEQIDALLCRHSWQLDVEEIPFTSRVPSGIKFYSAHFKFDALRHISSVSCDYAVLCDLDMVCLGGMPKSLANVIRNRTPIAYDITDLVAPAYGADVIQHDLEVIHGLAGEGRWMGGEFIGGTPGFFEALVSEVDSLWPAYYAAIGNLHHVGDEAVLSAAIERMRLTGRHISDAGTLRIVGRYWNLDTRHVQRAFRHYEGCFLLHLPADKPFLAALADLRTLSGNDFLLAYARHRRSPKVQLRRLAIRCRDLIRRQLRPRVPGA